MRGQGLVDEVKDFTRVCLAIGLTLEEIVTLKKGLPIELSTRTDKFGHEDYEEAFHGVN